MRSHRFHRARPLASAGLLALAALTAGCAKSSSNGTGGGLLEAYASARPASVPGGAETTDWKKDAEVYGARYRSNPRDQYAAIQYAQALRKLGQRAQAAAVLERASIETPRDRAVLGAYGRALAETGRYEQALEVLSRAHSPDQPDWRILSAQGAILDQMARHDEARQYYASALKIAANEPSVLSNLALSYALSKELPKAEETLRRAAEGARADRRVRQNLALIVGLQGRFEEAEGIARADLPATEAAENVAYLRSMLAEPNRWKEMRRPG